MELDTYFNPIWASQNQAIFSVNRVVYIFCCDYIVGNTHWIKFINNNNPLKWR